VPASGRSVDCAADFTPFVEAHLAYDVVHILNRFFKAVGDAILINNGVIHQYVGDQIVGLFGVGGDPPEKTCLDTIRAGLGMRTALNDLNEQLSDEFGTSFETMTSSHFSPLERLAHGLVRVGGPDNPLHM
jgi:adenylate cyclase